MSKRSASLVGWLTGLLTIVLLLSTLPTLSADTIILWSTLVGLTVLMINLGLTFSQGEISAAHSIGLMAYLILATPDDTGIALWAVAVGALIGVSIREIRRHYWQDWGILARTIWEPTFRTIGQLTLGLAIGGWAYRQFDGTLPLQHFDAEDVLPILGFVSIELTVYLALLLVQMRSQKGQEFRETILLNWQSLVGMLGVPIPLAVLAAVVYGAVSTLAFAVMTGGLVVLVMGVYGLSLTQHRYEQQVRDFSTLATISNAMRTNLNMASLMQVLYLQVASLLDVQNITLALYDAARKSIYFPLHIVDGQPRTLASVPYLAEAVGRKHTRQIPYTIMANANVWGVIPASLPRTAWMTAPILTSEHTMGAIIVAGENEQREFTPQDQQLLATITAQLGVAIDNAQLYEQSRKRAAQLRTLTRVSTQLSRNLNARSISENIVKYAPEVVGANAAAIYRWHSDPQQRLVLVQQYGLSKQFSQQPPLPLIAQTPNRIQPLVISDSHTDTNVAGLSEVFDKEGKQAWVEIPMRNAEQAFGVLVVYYDTPYQHSDEDLEVLQTYANQATLAVSNAELYSSKEEALNRRIEQLSLLEVLGQELFSSRIELERVYERVLKRAVEGTGATAGMLLLRDNGSTGVRVAASAGYPDSHTLDPMLGISHHVLHTADATIIPDVWRDPRFPPMNPDSRSLLCVPILQDVSVIGAITLESNAADCFGNEDMIYVMQIGAQIRLAMDNAKMIYNIESTRDRLQTILDSMTEAILLVNREGLIRLANPRAETMLGLEAPRLIDRRVEDMLLSEQFAEKIGFDIPSLHRIMNGFRQYTWSPEGQRHNFTRSMNGQQRFLERTDVPVRGQSGEVLGWLMVFVDVTEERELTQAREDLYNMIIHDLRSPLTAINATLKLVNNLSPDDSAGQMIRQATDTAGRAVRKLLNLVNSLLDISKMEAGSITLQCEASSAGEIADGVLKELGPLAKDMEVELINDIPADLPFMDVDEEKIERVLLNLVDNAIKFTPSRGRVRLHALPHDERMVRVQVIDNGPGIPDEYKDRLFDRYVQIEGQVGRRRGTGLGLAFCRLAVEAHGGRIWVEDNPGGGSIFNMTLPLAFLD